MTDCPRDSTHAHHSSHGLFLHHSRTAVSALRGFSRAHARHRESAPIVGAEQMRCSAFLHSAESPLYGQFGPPRVQQSNLSGTSGLLGHGVLDIIFAAQKNKAASPALIG